jgi:hypothetical protein
VADEFKVHLLNAQGLQRAGDLATAYEELLAKIRELVPAGRPQSIAITKLQEASFWSKRGIAELPENQQT